MAPPSPSPAPPPSAAAAAAAATTTTSAKIHTYHCAGCSTLLLGTSQAIDTLAARKPPVLDGARILPLRTGTTDTSADGVPASRLPGLKRDASATVVQREDGYETRWPWRCVRCGTVAGYTLLEGPEVLATATVAAGEGGEKDASAAAAAAAAVKVAEGRDGRLGYAIFLLETSLVSSEELERLVEQERKGEKKK